MPDNSQPTEVVKLDLSAGSVHTLMVDGVPHVVLKPAIEELGLDFRTQLRKLKTRSWAVVGEQPTTGADGKTYGMKVVPQRTFMMLLATINENNIDPAKRPVLIAFQGETADAIEAYWTKGGAVNPSATVEQVQDLRTRLGEVERAALAKARLEAWGVAKQLGLVNDSYAEAGARTELARMSGAEPDIAPADYTVTADEYLTDKGVRTADLASARSRLGKAVAALYRARYAKDPQKVRRLVGNVHREVAVYTYRDIDLFDTAWSEIGRHYNTQPPLDGAA
jgi:hypothetical protein